MIRDATKEDTFQVVELLSDLHAITSLSPLDFSEVKARRGLISFIESGQFFRVVDIDGEVVGVFIGLFVPTWFGSDSIAVDIAWYVKPENRGVSSVKLLKQFIEWAKEKGAKQIRPGVSTGSQSACDIYRKLGFVETGSGFSLTI